MLNRYKKPKGFVQLLQLIETSTKDKRDRFLDLINEESEPWAEALKQKMITLDKIFAWPENVVGDIMSRAQELTLAVAKHGFSDEQWKKATSTFDHKKVKMIEQLAEDRPTSKGEIATAFMTIIGITRSLIDQGFIYLEQLDPSMILGDDIEDKLERKTQAMQGSLNDMVEEPKKHEEPEEKIEIPKADGGFEALVDNMSNEELKVHVVRVAEENTALKNENKKLKQALAQLKKAA